MRKDIECLKSELLFAKKKNLILAFSFLHDYDSFNNCSIVDIHIILPQNLSHKKELLIGHIKSTYGGLDYNNNAHNYMFVREIMIDCEPHIQMAAEIPEEGRAWIKKRFTI